jgi:3-deoxy-manno-octulosonate cytidylyltransferase (CMP-KDO synthetase)
MVVRTAKRAMRAEMVGRVVVATDDERIIDACRDGGVEAVLTSAEHENGTERVAEAGRIVGTDNIVNVQGDEPLIEPASIDALVKGLLADGEALVANVACPMPADAGDNPNIVKAAYDLRDRLIFLSRCAIPFSWNNSASRWRHLGLYAFRGDALARYIARGQGPIELAERIEMYRFIEYGDPIALVKVPEAPPAVDVPDDVVKVNEYVDQRGGWD